MLEWFYAVFNVGGHDDGQAGGDDPARMTKAGVPESAQRFREKWRIALDLLDEMKPQLPVYQAIVFDAGYGVVCHFWRNG